MIKQREALELALDAFENVFGKGKRCYDAIAAIKEALAEPEPLTDEQIDAIIASNVTITDPHLLGAVYMAIREVEAAHGIGEA